MWQELLTYLRSLDSTSLYFLRIGTVGLVLFIAPLLLITSHFIFKRRWVRIAMAGAIAAPLVLGCAVMGVASFIVGAEEGASRGLSRLWLSFASCIPIIAIVLWQLYADKSVDKK